MGTSTNIYTRSEDQSGSDFITKIHSTTSELAAAGCLLVDTGAAWGVVGADNALPVSVAALPLPTGAATAANQPIVYTNGDLSGTLSFAKSVGSGEATPILCDEDGRLYVDGPALGATTETAPASDTASSGLNGRLQRIAQRLTSLIAQIPATLGIKTAAASLSIAPASDASFVVADGGGSITVDIAAAQTLATVTTLGTITNALPAGTNAIGKLAANSGVDIGDVDVTTLPARTATVDAITAKLATDTLQNGLTALTPKFVAISGASSGNNTILAAVASKKIRVLSYSLVCTTAVTAKFQSGAGGTDLTGAMPFGANGGISVPFNPLGHFETASNTLLNMSLGGAVQVSGHLCYVEV